MRKWTQQKTCSEFHQTGDSVASKWCSFPVSHEERSRWKTENASVIIAAAAWLLRSWIHQQICSAKSKSVESDKVDSLFFFWLIKNFKLIMFINILFYDFNNVKNKKNYKNTNHFNTEKQYQNIICIKCWKHKVVSPSNWHDAKKCQTKEHKTLLPAESKGSWKVCLSWQDHAFTNKTTALKVKTALFFPKLQKSYLPQSTQEQKLIPWLQVIGEC